MHAATIAAVRVTVNEQVDVFPQGSVAVYVIVVVVPGANVEPEAGPVRVGIIDPEQASLAVGVAHVAVAVQAFNIMLAGHPLITGAVTSFTVIFCEAVDVFPLPSTAVHVLVTL